MKKSQLIPTTAIIILLIILVIIFFYQIFKDKNKVTCAIDLYDENGGLLFNLIEDDGCYYLQEYCDILSYCYWEEGRAIGRHNSLGACTCIP